MISYCFSGLGAHLSRRAKCEVAVVSGLDSSSARLEKSSGGSDGRKQDMNKHSNSRNLESIVESEN